MSDAVVRINMSVDDAGRVAGALRPREGRNATVQRLMDQLWLRSVLVEQRRRTRIAERDAFDRRADVILAALDPASEEAEASA
jgi:hypothetical protein